METPLDYKSTIDCSCSPEFKGYDMPIPAKKPFTGPYGSMGTK